MSSFSVLLCAACTPSGGSPIDDETLALLASKRGLIQVVAFRSYLLPAPAEKMRRLNLLADEFSLPHGNIWSEGDTIFSALFKQERKRVREYFKKLAEVNKGTAHASVDDFVDHVDYLVKKIGVEHVGISSDFGGGGGIDGWQDASQTPNITMELLKRGYSKVQIQKIWGGNLLRVWRDVRASAHDAIGTQPIP